MITSGLASFKLSFVISPIILTGGVAGSLPGAAIPMLSLTQPTAFPTLLSPGDDLDLDDFFAYFQPIQGTTLVDNAIGEYPFANQTVAANAIIAQPLTVSMLMICPVNEPNTYAQKFALMQALQATLAQHGNSGGTYTVLTPSFVYTNCILTRMADVSSGDSHQPQYEWQLDFKKPLVTLQDAAQAQNNLMGKISEIGRAHV